MEITQVAEYLVIDSGGFIKNAPLHQYGEQLITMYDVIDEIRDKPTKQRLSAMPFELTYKSPDSTSIQKGSKYFFGRYVKMKLVLFNEVNSF
jgi:RNA-binding protein NOB1